MHLIGSGLFSPVRIQHVVIENAVSGDQELGFGVPQGSVWVRRFIACTPNLLVTSFSDSTLMQMTSSGFRGPNPKKMWPYVPHGDEEDM